MKCAYCENGNVEHETTQQVAAALQEVEAQAQVLCAEILRDATQEELGKVLNTSRGAVYRAAIEEWQRRKDGENGDA